MPERFFEKWSRRIRGAWSVLTGHAYARPYWLDQHEWTPFDEDTSRALDVVDRDFH